MAIIQCPECGGTVSTTANHCIHCGAKISVCPQCENVWVGEGNFCTKCGFNMTTIGQNQNAPQQPIAQQAQYDPNQYNAQQNGYAPNGYNPAPDQFGGSHAFNAPPHEPTYLDLMLEKFRTENLSVAMEKRLNGGLRFLFKFFGVMTGVLLGIAALAPIACRVLNEINFPMTPPTHLAFAFTPVATFLALFSLIIHILLSPLKDRLVFSALRKELIKNNYDVKSRARYELLYEWEKCNDTERLFKAVNTVTLFDTQVAPKSVYHKTVSTIVWYAFHLVFTVPMLLIGWIFFVSPIITSVSSIAVNSSSSFINISNPGAIILFWVVALIIYLAVLIAGYIIFLKILGSVELKLRMRWLEENMPDLIEVYNTRILDKKKKK